MELTLERINEIIEEYKITAKNEQEDNKSFYLIFVIYLMIFIGGWVVFFYEDLKPVSKPFLNRSFVEQVGFILFYYAFIMGNLLGVALFSALIAGILILMKKLTIDLIIKPKESPDMFKNLSTVIMILITIFWILIFGNFLPQINLRTFRRVNGVLSIIISAIVLWVPYFMNLPSISYLNDKDLEYKELPLRFKLLLEKMKNDKSISRPLTITVEGISELFVEYQKELIEQPYPRIEHIHIDEDVVRFVFKLLSEAFPSYFQLFGNYMPVLDIFYFYPKNKYITFAQGSVLGYMTAFIFESYLILSFITSLEAIRGITATILAVGIIVLKRLSNK